MDRLSAMSVFVRVAEEQSFVGAGRKMNISPPSVTRAINDLEEHLGAKLFHRTTRNVALTEVGVTYLEDCQRILTEIETAESNAGGIHRDPRGMVGVTASSVFGRKIVTPILLDFLDTYPKMSVSAMFVDRVVNLVEEGMDVAVRIADLPDSALTAVRVGQVYRQLCASPDYIAAMGTPQSPNDLSGHKVIDFFNLTPNSEWSFQKDARRYGHRPQSRIHVNGADVAIQAAVKGHGIARVLSYQIAEEVQDGRLEILLPDYTPPAVPVHVVRKEAGQPSGRVRATFDFLVDKLRSEAVLKG